MQSLRASAVSGVKWTGFSAIGTSVLQYGQLVVLARLLQTEDFGLVGMITVVIGFSRAFVDMGISNAIIWKQDADRNQLSSLYWLNIAAGFVLFGMIVAAAPLISRFYQAPELNNLIYLSALLFLIIPFGQQFQMLLQRELLFKRLAIIEVLASSIGVFTAIIAAALDCGAYSLIYGQLANAGTRSLLLAWTGWRNWRPHLHFKCSDMRGFIRFGLFQMGERSLHYLTNNVDYIMVGKFLGPETLGIYILAYKLVVEPFQRINPILTRVAFPVFAKRQTDNSALSRGYIELIKVVSLVTLPILVLLATTSPVLVPAVFGEKWSEAIPLIQILSLMGFFMSLNNPIGSVLLAKGRADIGFYKNLCSAIIATLVFWLAAQQGSIFMAWSEVAVDATTFLVFILILRAVIGMKPSDYFRALLRPLVISLFTGTIVYGCYLLLDGIVESDLFLLIILMLTGGFLFILLSLFSEKELVKDYWRYSIGKSIK